MPLIFNRHEKPIFEEKITWAKNFAEPPYLPFLREVNVVSARRKGKPTAVSAEGRYIVAWSDLHEKAPSYNNMRGHFLRRAWYRNFSDDGGPVYVVHGMGVDCPGEGVLPESIKANEYSMCAGPELWVRPRPMPGQEQDRCPCSMCGGYRVISCNCTRQELPGIAELFYADIPPNRLDLAANYLREIADALDKTYDARRLATKLKIASVQDGANV